MGSIAQYRHIAFFTDYGRSWNTDAPDSKSESLTSVGIGFRWDPTRKLHAELYAAKSLISTDSIGQSNDFGGRIQASGITFLLLYSVF